VTNDFLPNQKNIFFNILLAREDSIKEIDEFLLREEVKETRNLIEIKNLEEAKDGAKVSKETKESKELKISSESKVSKESIYTIELEDSKDSKDLNYISAELKLFSTERNTIESLERSVEKPILHISKLDFTTSAVSSVSESEPAVSGNKNEEIENKELSEGSVVQKDEVVDSNCIKSNDAITPINNITHKNNLNDDKKIVDFNNGNNKDKKNKGNRNCDGEDINEKDNYNTPSKSKAVEEKLNNPKKVSQLKQFIQSEPKAKKSLRDLFDDNSNTNTNTTSSSCLKEADNYEYENKEKNKLDYKTSFSSLIFKKTPEKKQNYDYVKKIEILYDVFTNEPCKYILIIKKIIH